MFKKFIGTSLLGLMIAAGMIVFPASTLSAGNAPSTQEPQRSRTVRGTVTDENGAPVPGAGIVVVGTNVGTNTDMDGNFTIDVPQGAKIEISFIGYLTQQVSPSSSTVNIQLSPDVEALEEAIAIGYGTVKKSDLTGAVATVAAKDFINQPASTYVSVLAGKVSGLTVRRTNGSAGRSSTIRVRGTNSIKGGNDPLIVVDGNYGGMPDANDIVSIEVLKDASATAIYGSRGANGVILVTTKRGRTGKPTVNLYSDVSVDKIINRYDMLNSYDFAKLNSEAGFYTWTDEELNTFKNGPTTNWQDEIFRTAVSQNHKVAISGGSDRVRYYLSPYWNKRNGTLRNNWSEGYGISGKLDLDLSDRVTRQTELNAGHGESQNATFSDSNYTSLPITALLWAPIEPVIDAVTGHYSSNGKGTGTLLNPVLLTTNDDRNYSNSGSAIFNLKVNILDGLDFNGKFSLSQSNGWHNEYQSSERNNGTSAIAGKSSSNSKSWLLNGYLTYTKTFADVHNFQAMAGFEETRSSGESLSGKAQSLPIESFKWNNLGLSAPMISVGSGYWNSAMRSFFGRVNYNYANRYYLTANFRADGSSKFRDGKKFGYFPSFSLAWNVANEPFMQDQELVSTLKIRGGWGKTGNQAVGDYATYTSARGKGMTWGTGSIVAAYMDQAGSDLNLTWETTAQTDIGVDLGLWDDRLGFTFDWYKKNTTDLLAGVNVPGYSGGDKEYGRTEITTNVGSMMNRGWEIGIRYNVIRTRDWNWDMNLNLARNVNKVTDIGENDIIYGDTFRGTGKISPFVIMKGEALGAIRGLHYLGIWQESESAEAALYGQYPGDYKYYDKDGDHSYDPDDYEIIGKSNPDLSLGFNNTVTWKNFTMNILFDAVFGRDVLNYTYMMINERQEGWYTAATSKNRWTPSNPNAEFCKAGSNSAQVQMLSDHYMQDASYIKLRNLSLAYRIPRKVFKWADVQVSVSGQNFLTITKYKGYDPEVNSNSDGNDVSAGCDYYAYPLPASLSFGLTITY